MAEAVFKHTVKQKGLEDRFERIESFGTAGYHVGEDPDPRSSATCRKHGVPVSHSAQQIKAKHFDEFDYIICMDESNLRNLKRLQPKNSKAQVSLFGKWNTDGKFREIVDDPYYGGNEGFEYNFKQVQYFSEQFLEKELK
ncbi:Low molecular weight phosphotyrosine protein phosphatase [Kluyveromyces marxianus]|nr:tyrosine protein phosphatase [Kluyveromyces marxianus]